MGFQMLGYIPWWIQTLAVLFFIVCVFLIIIVLLQKGKGGGLSAAFGGAGGQSAFGSKTGDVFTWVTVVVVVIFFVLAGVLTINYRPYDEYETELPAIVDSPPTQGQPADTPTDAETIDGAKADQGTDEKPASDEGTPATEEPSTPEDKPAVEKPATAEDATETPVEEKNNSQ